MLNTNTSVKLLGQEMKLSEAITKILPGNILQGVEPEYYKDLLLAICLDKQNFNLSYCIFRGSNFLLLTQDDDDI